MPEQISLSIIDGESPATPEDVSSLTDNEIDELIVATIDRLNQKIERLTEEASLCAAEAEELTDKAERLYHEAEELEKKIEELENLDPDQLKTHALATLFEPTPEMLKIMNQAKHDVSWECWRQLNQEYRRLAFLAASDSYSKVST